VKGHSDVGTPERGKCLGKDIGILFDVIDYGSTDFHGLFEEIQIEHQIY
jgi:hypothetical protein